MMPRRLINRMKKQIVLQRVRHPLLALLIFPLLGNGCQVLTYTGPGGERFSRTSFAATTVLSSLTIETCTNGIRRVELRGYQNDSTQALGTVTEAAVRAAIQGSK